MSFIENAFEVVQRTSKVQGPLFTDSDHPANLGACLGSVFNNTNGIFEFYTPQGKIAVDCQHRVITQVKK